jgi:pyruvate/2-oxoglutarate dehydrogenase complex dihydrolipoamide acyltransferase (E2) component
MQRLFHSRSFYIVIAAVLIVSVLYFLFQTVFTNKIPDDIEIQAVTRGSVIETISETGFVQPVRQVDLAFESGGRVASLSVQEGDFVDEGTILATLDASTILTELSAAYARLEAEQIRLNELVLGADSISLGVTESAVQSAEVALENAKDTLEKTIAQHDLLVQNARKTLMSSGLEAHFAGKERGNSSNSYEPPVITGTYESNEEGTYIIDPYSSSAASGGSFFLSGLETDTEAISTTNPQALGRRGLYIQFPEDFAKNVDVLWEVPVPNTRSDSYLTNLNAYNTAVEARDAAIAGAENAVKSADAALTESNQQLTQVSSSARDERIEAQRALVRQMRAGA